MGLFGNAADSLIILYIIATNKGASSVEIPKELEDYVQNCSKWYFNLANFIINWI